jgi:hypothetical protein
LQCFSSYSGIATSEARKYGWKRSERQANRTSPVRQNMTTARHRMTKRLRSSQVSCIRLEPNPSADNSRYWTEEIDCFSWHNPGTLETNFDSHVWANSDWAKATLQLIISCLIHTMLARYLLPSVIQLIEMCPEVVSLPCRNDVQAARRRGRKRAKFQAANKIRRRKTNHVPVRDYRRCHLPIVPLTIIAPIFTPSCLFSIS